MAEIVYEQIDCEGLATCLAEDAWKEETKNISTDDLYDTMVEKGAGIKKEIKPYWANNFFMLRETFLKLIHDYKKR